MITEFVRDQAFTIGWLGLMAFVWFGWGQEDPPPHWRWRLGLGSGLGVVLAGVFGSSVAVRWSQGSALEGRYPWFGVLVAAEVLVAGVGCLVLARRRAVRWMAWWVAVVVAVHFVPLALFLADWSLAVLGVAQLVLLTALLPRLRREEIPSSRSVGPVMGGSLLAFAVGSLVVFLATTGSPW